MPGPVAPVNCPKCGGPMWDNSRDPKKSKAASDYRCKDRQNCNGGIWLSDADRAAAAPTQAPPTGSSPAGPKRPPIILDKMMKACLEAAGALVEFIQVPDQPPVGDDIVLRIAQSLFIARTDNKGILEIEREALIERAKKERAAAEEAARIAQEKADAERRAREDEANRAKQSQPANNFDDFPAALEDQDDDLPF